jgi:threonine/homoserine/homoserine lactone efflux protein
LANAINPKVALFFLAFLPQFVSPTGHPAAQIGVLGAVFTLSAMTVFQSIALFSGVIGGWLRRHSGVGLWLDRLTGVLFIGLAARLAFARR